jgi:hypothetical protein
MEKDSLGNFLIACKSQWEGGGKRYALEEDKEYTDLVCEVAGNVWIGGNIVKYAGEIFNYKIFGEKLPEVDFFKIAVYAFIWWLKEFKHPTTGIRLKEKYWGEFVEEIQKDIPVCELAIDSASSDFPDGDVIGYEDFIVLVQNWKYFKDPKSFFHIASYAYLWWLHETGNFTDRDEGEEFEGGSKE